MIRVERYDEGLLGDWNCILEDTEMATFLHRRSYMEYHSERFRDFSLIAFDQKKPVALLPANVEGEQLISHRGLTYGGFVFRRELSAQAQQDITHQMLEFIKNSDFRSLYLKPVPSLFALKQTSISDLVNGFEMEILGKEVTLAIPLPLRPETWKRDKRRGLRKAFEYGLLVQESASFGSYWQKVLIPNLWERYNAKPVHSLEEITMLGRKHPIRQFNVYQEAELLAGMTVYEMGDVAHVQYTSTTEKGRSLRALDFLIYQLCTEVYPHKKYLNLGTSHEQMGRVTKENLYAWKQSYGSVPFEHGHYLVGF